MNDTHARGARLGRLGALATALLLAAFAAPGAVHGAVYESYSLTGYEVWFSPTVGTFVGTGRGTAGELAAWHSSIEHSVVVNPTGTITGGWATLFRVDGVRISGWFSEGSLQQTNDGPGCTNESHTVTGRLSSVSRSDTGAVGTGVFHATLEHHRVWLFGRCISYSASVNGTISLLF